jgi:hypothetical protein
MAPSQQGPYNRTILRRYLVFQHVTVGELLSNTKLGLEIRQQRMTAADARLRLLAPLALSILYGVDALCSILNWTVDN